MSAMLSRRELDATRADLRRWSKQLLTISSELTEMVNEIGENGNGGNEDGDRRAEGPEGHRQGGR